MSKEILTIKDVNRSYVSKDGSLMQVLDHVNLNVNEGEFISIIGSSGCGKTTLLRLIAGLDNLESGEIRLQGELVKGPDPKRGFVFQQGCLFPWLTIEENIASALRSRKLYNNEHKERIRDFIHRIGLSGFENVFPHQISGGMAQRVAIIRALINDPQVLLLDEPMGALDSFTRAEIQDLLLELRREKNTTMILVTHDIDEALYLSDRIVIMTPRPGRISEVLDVRMSHPRERGSYNFLEQRKKILERFDLARSSPLPEYNI